MTNLIGKNKTGVKLVSLVNGQDSGKSLIIDSLSKLATKQIEITVRDLDDEDEEKGRWEQIFEMLGYELNDVFVERETITLTFDKKED